METRTLKIPEIVRRTVRRLSVWGMLLPWWVTAAGTWTQLAHLPPGSVSLMLLLPDGTVMAANMVGFNADVPPFFTSGKDWYRLSPDARGSYVNGNWTRLASMHDTRLFYSSAVLRDGRVLVAGGEYGTGGFTTEVYNPSNDTWTLVVVPAGLLSAGSSGDAGNAGFRDSACKILPNGSVLVAPVFPGVPGGTLIFDPIANSWSAGPSCLGSQNEASWVKLPDDSILTVDKSSTQSERYIPSSNTWINDADVGVSLYSIGSEIGAALLLPDGRAFFLGASGKTALYTPTGNNNPGTWTTGPDIPNDAQGNAQGAADAPAAVMANGKILCAVTRAPYVDASGTSHIFNAQTSFCEYDPVANKFTTISGPTGPTDNIEPFRTMLLDLPDGTVLYSHEGGDFYATALYAYQPDGSPLASGKPTITSITENTDHSYHLTGTGLNGISEGAAYGDDAQMDSNYPLVRLADAAGNIRYARTFHWSSTSVMTGNRLVTTEFALPPHLLPGAYSLVVVANGISSDPVSFSEPVWVDFALTCFSCGDGTFDDPYSTFQRARGYVAVGGTIRIKAGSSGNCSPTRDCFPMTITSNMRIEAFGGPVTLGQ